LAFWRNWALTFQKILLNCRKKLGDIRARWVDLFPTSLSREWVSGANLIRRPFLQTPFLSGGLFGTPSETFWLLQLPLPIRPGSHFFPVYSLSCGHFFFPPIPALIFLLRQQVSGLPNLGLSNAGLLFRALSQRS